MTEGFHVWRRNPGHWDIGDGKCRVFCIRGGPGKYCVRDERPEGGNQASKWFKTVSACMAYICDELMYELIIAKGQNATEIEDYHIL